MHDFTLKSLFLVLAEYRADGFTSCPLEERSREGPVNSRPDQQFEVSYRSAAEQNARFFVLVVFSRAPRPEDAKDELVRMKSKIRERQHLDERK